MRVDTVDDPTIEDACAAIIRVTNTVICGSDLHIYNGAAPQPQPQPQPHPLTLSHEFMGIVGEVGRGVGNLKHGDRVVMLFPMHQWFDKSVSIRAGQAPVHKYIDRLLKHVADGDVQLDDIISHRLPLTEAAHGYDIFCNKKDNCTKVVLKPGV